jgi:hypothetical protein
MKKIALFVFNGDPMCFIHVLLNALDMKQKEYDAKGHPLHQLWKKARGEGLIEGVCKACASKMETITAAKAQGLPLLEDMLGHPAMARYHEAGYEIITF